jgi:hypothetical protein
LWPEFRLAARLNDALSSGEKMPGWNLREAGFGQLRNKVWSLAAAVALLFVALPGCTKFAPGAFQDLLANKPEAWRAEATEPADIQLAPDAKAALNSLRQKDSADGEQNRKSILPEIDPAELDAMNQYVSTSQEQADEHAQSQSTNEQQESLPPTAQASVQQVIPAAGLIGQPLRPLTFDQQSRKRIVEDVESLRQDNIIKLTADPVVQPEEKPSPQASHTNQELAVESELPAEPSLPPLEIVDARYIPNATRPVELPVPDVALDESNPGYDSMNSPAATQFDSPGHGSKLQPLQPAPETELANLPSPVEADSTPLFAGSRTPDEPAFDGNTTTNDFELPSSRRAPGLANDFQNGIEETGLLPQPVQRIDSHSDDSEPVVDVGAAMSLQSSPDAVVGAAASLPVPAAVEPIAPRTGDQGLRLVNANFCTAVSGYGQFDAFAQDRFGPNQHLLVYCEIENFHSVKDEADGSVKFVTRLRGSYTIVAADGKTVDHYEFPVVDDIAGSQRHDFYVHLPVQLGDLAPGKYSVQLNIDDLNGNSSANLANPLEFEVIQ